MQLIFKLAKVWKVMAFREKLPNSATLEFLKFCNNQSAEYFHAPYSSDLNTMFKILHKGSNLGSYNWNFMLPKPSDLQLENCQNKIEAFKRYSLLCVYQGTVVDFIGGITYKERMTRMFGEEAFNYSVNEDHTLCLDLIDTLSHHLLNSSDKIQNVMNLSVNLSKSSTAEDALKTAQEIMDDFGTLQDAVEMIHKTYMVCSWIDRWNPNEFHSFYANHFFYHL